LRQSPRNIFERLKENLIRVGFKQSGVDPFLFISEKVICLVYIDDTLFFSPNESDINVVVKKLRELNLDLNVEDDVAGFLGVLIKKLDGERLELTQAGPIKRILDALGIEELTPNQRQQRLKLYQKINQVM